MRKHLIIGHFAKSLFVVLYILSGFFLSESAMADGTDDFVITINTSNPGVSSITQFIIPTTGSGYNYDVDWDNNGTWDATGNTGNVICNYAAAGTYTIRIRGTFPRIYFNNSGDRQKILSVEQWGTGAWTSMNSAFYGCSNLKINATDVPNLSNVTDMSIMFAYASSLNQPIGNWSTGNVTDMSYLFYHASSFNQAIGNWNTGNVTNMYSMLCYAGAFNQPIGNWDTKNVTNMGSMLAENPVFNQPIGNWNTGNVMDMSCMFGDDHNFNQPIGNWNTAKVTTMSFMFADAWTFNQNIGNWDTGNVIDMSNMFCYARAFNQNIGSWNTGKVTSMNEMFSSDHSFNQAIGGWNTGSVTDMSFMFADATQFNQAIGGWNTGNVAAMSGMFENDNNFNQNVGSWNVCQLTNASNMFSYSNLSKANYDALLVGWNSQTLKSNVTFDGGFSQYDSGAAQTARTNMVNNYHWIITDGGLYVPPTPTPTITPTSTISATSTITPTSTPTTTKSPTSTITPTITVTLTISPTSTITVTYTMTQTTTITPARTFVDLGGRTVLAYPNPARNLVHFVWAESNAEKAKISIYNLSGERVATLTSSMPGQAVDWNAAGVAPGIYIYRVVLTENSTEQHLPIQKIAILKP